MVAQDKLDKLALSPSQMLRLGLSVSRFSEQRIARASFQTNVERFKNRYGSDHVVLSKIWNDLLSTTNPAARIDKKRVRACDFLMAVHFLRKYPSEADQAELWDVTEKTGRLWSWYFAEKIQGLKEDKIVWPERWNDPYVDDTAGVSEIFIISVDGIHCQVNEPTHPKYPKNHKMYSHKFKKAGLNYEVAVSLWENKVVWINGPFQASANDLNIFQSPSGLKEKIPEGRLGIADAGYRGQIGKLSLSTTLDSEEVRRFKSRAKARQESFNSRLKQFKCLDNRFRHKLLKHKVCFEAVCVICQYQLENGYPLYDI